MVDRSSQLKNLIHSPKSNSAVKQSNQNTIGVNFKQPLSFRDGTENQSSNDMHTPLKRKDTDILSTHLEQPTAPRMPLTNDEEYLLTGRFESLYEDPAIPLSSITELLETLSKVEYIEADGRMYRLTMKRMDFEKAIMNLRQAEQ